jgi:UDP-N-acetylglucosamine 3-dehydrogenase
MSFAHMHAGSYAAALAELPNAQIAGVADDDETRGKDMAARYGAAYFTSYQALLAAGVDAVVICTENARHRDMTLLAASAGKHVLCEKPLATNVVDAMAMIAACQQAGVQLMTAFPCRFHPAMLRVKAMVEEGRIGRILAIKGTNRGRNPGGWFIELEKSGGGAVMDHTVHVADLIRWLTGAEVTEVYAEVDNLINHADFDDVGFLTLQLSDGTFGTLDASWSRPKTFPFWGDVTLEIVGESGVISMDMFAQNLVLYSDTHGGISWVNWGSNMDLGLVHAFVSAVESGSPVPVTGEDGLRTVEVVQAAYRAADRKQPVTLPLET